MPRFFARLGSIVALCLTLVSAPWGPSAAAAPDQSKQSEQSTARTGEYRLGAGDKVRVIVFGEPTLSGEYVITGSGTLSFPLVGDVAAKGLTIPDFQDALRDRLADGYLKDPRVTVEVLTYRPFYILGEVNKPGEYAYTNGLTVMNAIATAGGFTYRANHKTIMLRAPGESAEHSEPLTATTPVNPGDTIRVRERYF
jgi:protein involved in polysaccharide export with SLBB domain